MLPRMGIDLRAGAAALRVEPADGGRATSLAIDGQELLGRGGTRPVDYGLFVMAPYAGRVRDGWLADPGVRLRTDLEPPHAMHGFGYDAEWAVVEAGSAHAVLRCAFVDDWPLGGEVEHRLELREDRLDLRLEVRSTGRPFPATAGWHPWFRRRLDGGEPVRLRLAAGGMLPRDAAGIAGTDPVPIPAGPWDDCFVDVAWPVVLEWPGALQVAVEADTRYVVVFDEKEPAVCVEPQTGPPDGVNTIPRLVTPTEPLTATMTLRWQ